MLLFEFPIRGELRLPLLTMESIFVIIGFEISLIFIFRYFRQEKMLRDPQDLGYFSIFFGYSLMWFFFIIANYYSSSEIVSPFYLWKEGSVRFLFLNFAYLSMITATFFVFLFIERYNIILYRKFLFTTVFGICAILFLILFFINIRMTQPVTTVLWIVFLSFFLIYLIRFLKKSPKKGVILFIGLSSLFTGFLLTIDMLRNIMGLQGRMVGVIIQLIAVVILYYFFVKLPPFSEFDWQEKLKALFLINNAGICLYYKVFNEQKELRDEQLISAALSSINVVLKEMTKSEEGSGCISVIKKKGENLIIYQGKFISAVLYTTEELNYPKIVLNRFVEKFEMLYQNILVDWKGDLDIFKPTEKIVNEMFII